MLTHKRGQSTLEYALIIAVVIAALLVLNLYMQKGVQGRLKESTDQIGRQFNTTNFTTAWKTASTGTTNTLETRNISDGSTTSNMRSSETANRSEYESWGTVPAQHY